MKIFVVIATLGRPDIVRRTVPNLERQTRLPDGVLISVVRPEDAGGVASTRIPVEILVGEKGSCRQRNAGLDALVDRADIVLFLDDDFVAADDFIEQLEALFAGDPALVGATGRVIADGINHAGYSFEQAMALVAADVPEPADNRPINALYGCNMAIRMATAGGIRFDEALPLYGWLEDVDYTFRIARRGHLLRANVLRGVHMGTKSGRTSGRKLGYSQIANPIYLLRKRSIPRDLAFRIMRNNILSNLARSVVPEPHIDRLGRLRGNLRAVVDMLRGRLDPRRILELE